MESCDDGDDVTYYLRNAQYYIEMGDLELGKSYLVKLCCETVDNYEESIGFRELTHVWDKYRHLVEGKVPASISWKALEGKEKGDGRTRNRKRSSSNG